MQNNSIYWHCFNKVKGLGPKNFEKLYHYFDCLKAAWLKAEAIDFKKAGLAEKLIQEILKTKRSILPEEEAQTIIQEDIQIITLKDKKYPARLKQIYDPPAVLYVKGDSKILNSKYLLAIVGSRRISDYGKMASHQIVGELTRAGIITVSGLAVGCDALVHQITLENKSQTIAVLGSGISWRSLYPQINLNLAKNIIKLGGAIISEYPPAEKAQVSYFPIRNRIISGLSLGTLIIEANEKSGALITAYSALDQNREVFAVPGSICHANSLGTNKLIQRGAKLTTTGQDIIDELCLDLELINKKSSKNLNLGQEEKIILEKLSCGGLHIDKIINQSKLPANLVNSALVSLEIKELVRNLGNQTYIKL